jgi:hypothetical protein
MHSIPEWVIWLLAHFWVIPATGLGIAVIALLVYLICRKRS